MLVVGILWGVCLCVFCKSLKYNKITAKIFGCYINIPYICNTKGGDKDADPSLRGSLKWQQVKKSPPRLLPVIATRGADRESAFAEALQSISKGRRNNNV